MLEDLKALNKEFGLRLEINDLARNWKEAYPTLNIREQLILANTWCVTNPKKAPKKNVGRFLNTWMKRAHEWSLRLPKPKIYVESIPDEDQLLTWEDICESKRKTS